MKDSAKSVAKAALAITLISALGKPLGLLRESVLAAYFGASAQTDAYKLAFGIPSILLAVIGAAITTTFIPVYAEYIRDKSKAQIKYFVNNIFNIVVLFSVLLTILGLLLTPVIVKLLAPGFDNETYNLTVKLTILALPCLTFLALFNLGGGFLQSNNRFIAPAVSWIVYDLIIIASMILFHKQGIEIITIGSVIAVASLFLVQLPSIIKTGYKFKLVLDFKEEGFRRIAFLTLPVLISSAFNQLYIFIDRILASGLDEGSISALDYANRINALVFNIFTISIVTVIYPKLSLISGELDKFKETLSKGLRIILLISLPMSAGLLVLRIPVVNILFERGAFNSYDTHVTAIALGCFSVGIIGVGFREILNKAFYSLKDTKTPMINGIIAICINIVLNFILVKPFGVGGLALATSTSALISSGMLLVRLRKRIGAIDGTEILICAVKALLATIAMSLVVFFLNEYSLNVLFAGSSFLIKAVRLIISISTGGFVYISALYILREEQLIEVTKTIRHRLILYLLDVKEGFYTSKI